MTDTGKTPAQQLLGELSRLTAEAEIAVTDMDAGDDLNDEQRSRRIDAAGMTGLDELQEIEELDRLARKVTVAQDSKLRYLVQRLLPARLRAHLRLPRVLVFTRYQDTLDYPAASAPSRGSACLARQRET